ncbi:dTDP-4-dehydrorhamnose reductase [Parabacteroides pacaensis]|uniref:dTDP-4-dehydrorhamnose reductase n=1 Tax=Parabacteroides pacaensis TaxID=2086575 RepID=UPI000D10C00B|nr:dTDP-4-dehydrorhamnose reductase [Parabacteroides pacaensis]
MKNILVTGANGQLGNEMRLLAKENTQYNFFFTDVDTLDICDKEAVLTYATGNKINYIINCAAYTAVDNAEDNEALCRKINRDAVRNLGEIAALIHAKVIHVSTDYVFDGTKHIPYVETDPTCPDSVYGRTKLAGEEALSAACPEAVIIRTAWLYSEFGNNFVKTMLRLGSERERLNVIFDQVGTPTYAADLALAIMEIVRNAEKGNFQPGIYHFSDEGVCSWYDFTVSILRMAGIVSCTVTPIETKDYPAKASRPHYSVLNKGKIKSTYHLTIPHWEQSLAKCIEKLKKQ